MKPVQVMMDEDLLERLDRSDEVRREGRSAVIRRATADYLERRREEEIREAYRRAYAEAPGLGADFEGWSEEGEWPEV